MLQIYNTSCNTILKRHYFSMKKQKSLKRSHIFSFRYKPTIKFDFYICMNFTVTYHEKDTNK